jgi:hypothetical protein
MFDKLVTAALLTISLILLTGFNRSSVNHKQGSLPLPNIPTWQAAQAMNNL